MAVYLQVYDSVTCGTNYQETWTSYEHYAWPRVCTILIQLCCFIVFNTLYHVYVCVCSILVVWRCLSLVVSRSARKQSAFSETSVYCACFIDSVDQDLLQRISDNSKAIRIEKWGQIMHFSPKWKFGEGSANVTMSFEVEPRTSALIYFC